MEFSLVYAELGTCGISEMYSRQQLQTILSKLYLASDLLISFTSHSLYAIMFLQRVPAKLISSHIERDSPWYYWLRCSKPFLTMSPNISLLKFTLAMGWNNSAMAGFQPLALCAYLEHTISKLEMEFGTVADFKFVSEPLTALCNVNTVAFLWSLSTLNVQKPYPREKHDMPIW